MFGDNAYYVAGFKNALELSEDASDKVNDFATLCNQDLTGLSEKNAVSHLKKGICGLKPLREAVPRRRRTRL